MREVPVLRRRGGRRGGAADLHPLRSEPGADPVKRRSFLALVYLCFLPDRIWLYLTVRRRTYIVVARRNDGVWHRFEAEWPELWDDLRLWSLTGERR